MERLENLPISPKAKIGIALGGTALLGLIISTAIYKTIQDLSDKGFKKITVKYKELTFEAVK